MFMYARESHDVSLSVGVGYVKKKLYKPDC